MSEQKALNNLENVIISDEDEETFWVSSEYAESIGDAYVLFVGYWNDTGLELEYFPKPTDIEMITGKWLEPDANGLMDWEDDEEGEEWYMASLN